ncbi:hypothetical protein FHJ31_03110 [Pseudomonas sp. Fig-3]|nr:hypothetical protein FHJ31_03110 [Pseudomonas sp. Fig-3]
MILLLSSSSEISFKTPRSLPQSTVSTNQNVGASLLAIAVFQSTWMPTEPSPSRAGSLPQGDG